MLTVDQDGFIFPDELIEFDPALLDDPDRSDRGGAVLQRVVVGLEGIPSRLKLLHRPGEPLDARLHAVLHNLNLVFDHHLVRLE